MKSGIYSVLPWMTMAVTSNVGGWIADKLVARGTSVTTVRKIMQSVRANAACNHDMAMPGGWRTIRLESNDTVTWLCLVPLQRSMQRSAVTSQRANSTRCFIMLCRCMASTCSMSLTRLQKPVRRSGFWGRPSS